MNMCENTGDTEELVSRHDLESATPPACWQDGLVMGNGSLGAVFSAPRSLEWLVNKTDVIDARVKPVSRIIPRAEADRMALSGASAQDFEKAEYGDDAPEGIGPKTCCHLIMDIGAGTFGALPDIHCRLALYDATLRIQLDKHLCHPRVESFVRADEDMLVIRVSEVSPLVSYRTRLFFSRPEDIDLPAPRLESSGRRLLLHMEMPEGVRYAAGLEVVPRPAAAGRDNILRRLRPKCHPPLTGSVQMKVRGRFGIIEAGGDFDVFLTVVTDRDAADPAAEVRRRLDLAVSQDFGIMRAPHQAWWREFWSRSMVELGDKVLEALFYRSLYALGCAYRKAPVSGLLGLCYGPGAGPMQVTPWNGDLHHDLNVQCPFFPVHTLNHSDLFDACLDTYHEFLPEARRLAREVWGAPGAHFDMCFNARGKSITGGVGAYRYFFGGSYVALMHCLCWRSRRDTVRLEQRIYPFLKEILAFYQFMMRKGEDGRYHIHPAHACELDVMNAGDPVQVISMLRICLETAIEAAAVLGVDPESADAWTDLLDKLPDYSVGVDMKQRTVVLDGAGIHPDHHVGQAGCLHPVYPCGEVDEFSSPGLLDLYNRTLDSVVEKTAQISYADNAAFHYRCVWQCFFRAMTALRLGRTEEFWNHYIPMFLDAYVKPNGLISHDACVIAPAAASEVNLKHIPDESLVDVGGQMPKFEAWCGHDGGATPNPEAKKTVVALIEGSADFLTMITETLLQSHNGIIRVFPAWPAAKDAKFTGFIAEGDIKVSSEFRDGRVSHIALERGVNCRNASVKVKSPWTGKFEEIELPRDRCVILRPCEE